jgi:hypothetical protein
MKRSLSILFTLSALLIAMPMNSADAGNGFGGGHGGRGGGHAGHHRGARFSGAIKHQGFGHGFGHGFGTGVFVDDDDSDLADLYRELLDNVPYFALHPPVYYSYPVPRTYGYSPFAYGPWVMTPEVAAPPEPVTIINPYVPKADKATASEASDRSAAVSRQPEPLVITNPYVTPNRAIAISKQ